MFTHTLLLLSDVCVYRFRDIMPQIMIRGTMKREEREREREQSSSVCMRACVPSNLYIA